MTPALGYTEMKDSGIPWVGQIPATWNVRVLFQLVSQVKCKNSDLQEQNLLSLSYGKIKRKNIGGTDGLLPASFDGYNIIENGDIVLRLTDLQNDHTSLRVGRATERGIITSAYTTLRPMNPAMSEYIYYLLHTFDIKKGFYGLGAGVRQGLNFDEVKMLKIPVPSAEMQYFLVTYLDAQCAKIDEIIAEAKASIEDYKQWEISSICQSVTKGVPPHSNLRNSGLEWIKLIPKGWNVTRAKNVLQKLERPVTPNDEIVICSNKGKVIFRGEKNPGLVSLTEEGYQGVQPGDLLIHGMDTWHGAIAVSSISGKCTSVVHVCESQENKKYIAYYLRNLAYRNVYKAISSGIRQNTSDFRSWDKLGNVPVLIPPMDEQEEIANYLDMLCGKIDALIAEKQSLIIDLESYKKSLIYEVVTGKRCVPVPSETTVMAVHPSILGYQKALLMCRVLDLLGDDARGRIHVQKCLFAVECLLKMPFQTQYVRYEHGPYDTHITDCEALIVENDWFTIQNGSPVIYKKGVRFNSYLDEYMKVFADMDSKIKEIVEFLKPMKTSQAERIATLLAAWNDFILDGTAEPTDQQIINEVMTNWTPNKAHTQLPTWQNTMDKLKQSGFAPAGFGVHTIKKEVQEV